MRSLFARVLLTFTAALTCITIQGQSALNDPFYDYRPARCSGEVPSDFRKRSSEKANDAKEEIRKSRASKADKKQESAYAVSSSFAVDALLSSGQILFGDSMSLFVKRVATRLLEANDEFELLQQLRFYVLKSPVPNAYCTSNGAVLISVGLLSRMENEAQLAFILSHEIQHYKFKHSLNEYKKITSLKSASANRRAEDILSEIYSFSKENEMEADEKGFEMMKRAGYNLDEGVYVFDILKYSEYPFLEISLPIDSFETISYKFPANLRKNIQNVVDNGIKQDEKHLEEQGNESNTTHPSLDRRVNRLRDMIAEEGKQTGKPIQFLGESSFNFVLKSARHELLLLYLRYADFGNAFYLVQVMERRYGQSLFLARAKAMTIYGLTHHKALNHSMNNYGCNITSSRGEWRPVIALFNEMPLKDLCAFGSRQMYYIKKAHKTDPFIDQVAREFFRIVQENALIRLGDLTVARAKTDLAEDTAAKTDEPENENGIKNPRNRTRRSSTGGVVSSDYYMQVFADIEDRDYLEQLMKDMEFQKPSRIRATGSEKKRKKKAQQVVENFVILPPQIELSYGNRQKRDLYGEEYYRDHLSRTWTDLGRLANVNIEVLKSNIGEDITVDAINSHMALNDWMVERLNNDTHSMILFNSMAVRETMTEKNTKLAGFISYEYSTSRKPFDAYYLIFSIYFFPTFPLYLSWQLSTSHKFNEICVIFDTESSKVVHLKRKQFSGKLQSDMVNAQIYETIYNIKYGK